MMGAPGTWLLDKAIKEAWDQANLTSQFRVSWGSLTSSTAFLALNDTEARPAGETGHPTPYCVFEQDQDYLRVFGDSGKTSSTRSEVVDVPVQFRVFARTKTLARDFAKLVADAFDRKLLDIEDTAKHVETFRDADFPTREDDATWCWNLHYRFRIELTFAAALS